jgi:hypothetical protein
VAHSQSKLSILLPLPSGENAWQRGILPRQLISVADITADVGKHIDQLDNFTITFITFGQVVRTALDSSMAITHAITPGRVNDCYCTGMTCAAL